MLKIGDLLQIRVVEVAPRAEVAADERGLAARVDEQRCVVRDAAGGQADAVGIEAVDASDGCALSHGRAGVFGGGEEHGVEGGRARRLYVPASAVRAVVKSKLMLVAGSPAITNSAPYLGKCGTPAIRSRTPNASSSGPPTGSRLFADVEAGEAFLFEHEDASADEGEGARRRGPARPAADDDDVKCLCSRLSHADPPSSRRLRFRRAVPAGTGRRGRTPSAVRRRQRSPSRHGHAARRRH